MLRGMSVAVVGGSIAGCGAALALGRAGCNVTVYERSTHLQDRGAGVAMPMELRDELIAAGYLDPGYATWPMAHRRWILKDGEEPMGRLLWLQKSEAVTNNWGNLWRSLRAQVPDAIYRSGIGVTTVRPYDDHVEITLTDGSTSRCDAVVGADGYRSDIRGLIRSGSTPRFAGYVLWRGNYEESRVTDRAYLDEADEDFSWFTVCFPGGHGVYYMIPGFENRSDICHRRVNWAIYAPTPEGYDFTEPTSTPPGAVDDDLYAHLDRLLTDHFPPYLESLVRNSPQEEVSLQPIYDEPLDRYAAGCLLVIGDAGTVTRPHTGSGATKALQDALALEKIARAVDTWDEVAGGFSRERVTADNKIVELGRRIGDAQVSHTPDWGAMTPADFEEWTAATLAGESLYFWGTSERTAATSSDIGPLASLQTDHPL